jgi:hypothetical protein
MNRSIIIKLADMIKNSRRENPAAFRNGEIREIANLIQNNNPNFDSDRFFDYLDGKVTLSGKKIK